MMCTRLMPGAMAYPTTFAAAGDEQLPPPLTCRGNPDLLSLPLLGILSSSDVPPDLILPILDLMLALRDAGVPLAGGFQSQVERVSLSILEGGTQPLVILPARAVEGMELSRESCAKLQSGTLLLLSAFPERVRRPSRHQAVRRNGLLEAISTRLVVFSAGPGSRTLKAAIAAMERGKRVFCFDHERNRDLLLLGAWPIDSGARSRIDPTLLNPASPSSRSG